MILPCSVRAIRLVALSVNGFALHTRREVVSEESRLVGIGGIKAPGNSACQAGLRTLAGLTITEGLVEQAAPAEGSVSAFVPAARSRPILPRSHRSRG